MLRIAAFAVVVVVIVYWATRKARATLSAPVPVPPAATRFGMGGPASRPGEMPYAVTVPAAAPAYAAPAYPPPAAPAYPPPAPPAGYGAPTAAPGYGTGYPPPVPGYPAGPGGAFPAPGLGGPLPPGWAPPAGEWAPTAPPRRGSLLTKIGAGLGVLILLSAGYGVVRRIGMAVDPLKVPTALGGHARLTGGDFDTARKETLADLRRDGTKGPIAEFYGSAGVPAYALVAGRNQGYSNTAEVLDDFIDGFEEDGPTGPRDIKRLPMGNGQSADCVSFGGELAIAACVFRKGDTAGVVMAFGSADLPSTAKVTGEAMTAAGV